MQTVHNQVTDQGESFLIQQAFTTGATSGNADNKLLNAICVTANVVDTSDAVEELQHWQLVPCQVAI